MDYVEKKNTEMAIGNEENKKDCLIQESMNLWQNL